MMGNIFNLLLQSKIVYLLNWESTTENSCQSNMVHLHRLKCTLLYQSGILLTIESLDATALNVPYISERTTVNCMYRGAEDWWVEPPDDEPITSHNCPILSWRQRWRTGLLILAKLPPFNFPTLARYYSYV